MGKYKVKQSEVVADGPSTREELDRLSARVGAVEDALRPAKPRLEPTVVDKSFYYVCVTSCGILQVDGSAYPCSDGGPAGTEAASVIRTDRPLPRYLTDGFKKGRPDARASVKFALTGDPALKARSQGVELKDWSD